MPTSPRANSGAIAERLGAVLASTYTLYLKTQNFHWNVEGPRFISLHELFETQYTELAASVDDIAERMRALGSKAPGSFAEFGKLTKIDDAPTTPPSEQKMIDQLVADNETLSKLCSDLRALADDLGDTGTGDILNGRIRAHDKAAWMLRAHGK